MVKHYLLASDFDQTLSFNDSGLVLAELLGIPRFEDRIAGLARSHLVQQGGELAFLLLHDADYRAVAARYREEAKDVMKQMDVEIAPRLAEAERIANEYLGKAVAAPAEAAPPQDAADDDAEAPERATCPKCSASNEADAAFCKKCGTAIGSAAAEKKADATG